MSDESFWIHFPSGKKISALSACSLDGDVCVKVEGDTERCVTFGSFHESNGSYGWVVSPPPPGAGWTLDREASAAKDFRVSYWRRPRGSID